MATLLDSYSESNQDASGSMGGGGSTANFGAAGQSFDSGSGGVLDSCKFYLSKHNSPTGNIYGKLYSHTGTFGSTGVPDTLLATSDAIDVSTLPAEGSGPSLITFTFTGGNKYSISASTKYFIVSDYQDSTGDNYVNVFVDTSSPTHPGNSANWPGSWSADSGVDVCFYIYIDDVASTLASQRLKIGHGR